MHNELEPKTQIKNVLHMVDELEASYDQRLLALQAEYQADIEEMLRQYKFERQQFDMLLLQQRDEINQLRDSVEAFKQLYQKASVEQQITRDSLQSALAELKTEQELLATAQERINSANAQAKAALEAENVVTASRSTLAKTREFFQQIMEARLARPIVLHKALTDNSDIVDEQHGDQDGFSY